jgi:formate-dependent phosphoribosylglycinamide formyltransferase (GAR transformylase)
MIGASYYQAPAFEKARALGLRVIGVDRDEQAFAKRIAHEFYPIDILDVPKVVQLAAEKKSCRCI